VNRAETLLALVRARNAMARSMDWPNYYSLRLALDGISGFEEVWSRWERKTANTVSAPEFLPERRLSEETLRSHGSCLLEDASDFSFDGGDRACTYLLDPPTDVRVVVGGSSSEVKLWNLWHELGHLWYGLGVGETNMQWSLRGAPATWLDEAIAEIVCEACADEYGKDVLGIATEQEHVYQEELQWRRHRRHRLQLMFAAFERYIYEEGDTHEGGEDVWEEKLAEKYSVLTANIVGGGQNDSWHSLETTLRDSPGMQSVYTMAHFFAADFGPRLPRGLKALRAFLTEHLFHFGATKTWPEAVSALDEACSLE
jgi:hypothetical protein